MTTHRFFRFRLKWLWLRHTHTFNWAHKPLCDRFKPGVLRIGKLHVCRSCLFAYSGMLIGGIAALVYSTFIVTMRLPWLACILAPVIILSYPRLYKRLSRFIQDGLRFAMGVLLGFIPFFLIYRNFASALLCIVVMFAFWRFYFHQRRLRKRQACEGCPELNLPEICSGFQQQAAAIRLYEIEATDFMYRTGRGLPQTPPQRR